MSESKSSDADPELPPTGEETRESLEAPGNPQEPSQGGGKDSSARGPPQAADRLLPYFLLGDSWEPDAYDETVLEWNGEAYLLECGRVHAFADEHDEHGDILALVVVEGWDWVDECRAIAAVTEPVRV